MSDRWAWSDGSRIKADAAKVAGQLQAIESRHGGVTPEAVIKASKSKRAPLHGYFEWNDQVAAHAYRMEQARHVIRCIRVVIGDGEESQPVRAFFNASPETNSPRSMYVGVATVVQDGDLLSRLREEAMRAIGCLYQRFEELESLPEFAEWFKATSSLLKAG